MSKSKKTDEMKQGLGAIESDGPDEQEIVQEKAEDTGTEHIGDESGPQDEANNTGAPAEEEKESDDARYMRLAADFQNFKRRTEKEKSEIYAYANEKIALDIIDVMDNFERAMAHSEDSPDKTLIEGMDLIFKQMKGVLDKHDIIEIDAVNKDFDPNYHNAVMAESNDEFESGKVIQVIQKGYTLKGKVIRPSMVKVSQ